MKWLITAVLGLTLALLPAFAFADNGTDASNQNDVLMRIGKDVYIPAGERVGTLIVINGNAVVDGDVTRSVVVVRGNVTISGSVGANLTVISGNADLQTSARVVNVTAIKGAITTAPGATVTGKVREQSAFRLPIGAIGLFSLMFWAAMTLAVLVAGLLFAAIGGHQLRNAAQAMTESVSVVLGVVFVWAAIPLIAVLAVATLIGLPLGVSLLVFLLPALWFLGYIVAGARLGRTLIGFADRSGMEHPYSATTVGLVLLQLIVLVPVVGSVLAIIAGIWGAGAIAVTAFKAARTKNDDTSTSSRKVQTPQPAA